MKEEIIELSDIAEDNKSLINDESIDIYNTLDTDNKSSLNGWIKLVLILLIAAISGFLLKDVFIAFANWIIFN